MDNLLDASGNPVNSEQPQVDEAEQVVDVITEPATDVEEEATPAVEAVAEDIPEEVVEEQPVVDEKVVERKEAAKKAVDLAEYGYVVGINEDGALIFQEVGSKQGYVQLLGLHEFAKYRIGVISDSSQQYGAALLAGQQGQLAQMLQVILNMLTNQSKQQIIGAAR